MKRTRCLFPKCLIHIAYKESLTKPVFEQIETIKDFRQFFAQTGFSVTVLHGQRCVFAAALRVFGAVTQNFVDKPRVSEGTLKLGYTRINYGVTPC